LYRCLNCGFKFVNPEYKLKPLPFGVVILIDPQTLNIPICPKCGSDALERQKKEKKRRGSGGRILDEKASLYINVLNVPKDASSLDKTRGVLSELGNALEKQGMDTPDLVKRAWKASEEREG